MADNDEKQEISEVIEAAGEVFGRYRADLVASAAFVHYLMALRQTFDTPKEYMDAIVENAARAIEDAPEEYPSDPPLGPYAAYNGVAAALAGLDHGDGLNVLSAVIAAVMVTGYKDWGDVEEAVGTLGVMVRSIAETKWGEKNSGPKDTRRLH